MIYSSISNKHSSCTYKSPPTKHHKKYTFEIVPSFPLPYSRTAPRLKVKNYGWERGPENLNLHSKHTGTHWDQHRSRLRCTPPAPPLLSHRWHFRSLLPLAPCLCHPRPAEKLFKKPSRYHRKQVVKDNPVGNRINQNPAREAIRIIWWK